MLASFTSISVHLVDLLSVDTKSKSFFTFLFRKFDYRNRFLGLWWGVVGLFLLDNRFVIEVKRFGFFFIFWGGIDKVEIKLSVAFVSVSESWGYGTDYFKLLVVFVVFNINKSDILLIVLSLNLVMIIFFSILFNKVILILNFLWLMSLNRGFLNRILLFIDLPQRFRYRQTYLQLIFLFALLYHKHLVYHLDSFSLNFGKEVVFNDMQKDVIYFLVLEVFKNLFGLGLWDLLV